MANIGNKQATVSVYVNAEQAKKSLESMKATLKEGKDLVKMYKEELNRLGNVKNASPEQAKQMAALNDLITKATKSNANLAKTITENETALTDFDSIAGRLSKGNLKTLYKDLRTAKNAFKDLASDDTVGLEKGRQLIKNLQAEIKKLETGYKGLDNVMKNIKTTPLEQLKLAEQDLVEKMNSLTRGTHAYATASAQLTQVRAQINSISEATAQAQQRQENLKIGYKGVADVMKNLSTAPLKHLKMAEEELVKKLSLLKQGTIEWINANRNLERVRKQIADIRQKAEDAKIGYKGIQDVLNNLKTSSIDKLKRAQQDLEKQLGTLNRGTKEYQRTLENLKNVRAQIDGVTRSFGNQDGAIMKVAKRLASYVAVYMGFNQLIGKTRQIVQGNLEISDSMADIQKVTKMTAGQVDTLARAIDRLDTRSAQDQLYKLGYQAGMLGLHTQSDILGFVKAADQMNWALKELGEDGAVQLMKVSMLTGELQKNGGSVEKTLLKVGSSINELTANSAASAGPVVDFVSRMGSVGSVCKYSSSELVGIASTLDALNVHAEMGGTAMNKFMSSLAKSGNITSIADKLGITDEAIRQAGGSMEQMIFVLEKLKEQGDGGMEALSPFFKDLGSDGERLKTVITTLVQNVDMLKDHVKMARDAYEEGTSATLEFEVKNETAAATFERLGNTIREHFINSGMVRWLQEVGQWLNHVLKYGDRHLGAITLINTAVGALRGALYALLFRTALLGMSKVTTAFTAFVGLLKNLKQSYITLKTSMLAYSMAEKTMIAFKAQGVTVTHAEALADAEAVIAKGAHTGATITLTGALKALYATMLANPFTAIAAAVGGLVALFVSLGDSIFGASEQEKFLEEATKNAMENIVEESSAINQKYEMLKLAIEEEQKYTKELENARKAGKDTTEVENRLNAAHREHEKCLKAVNDASGSYTGWMLKMSDTIDVVTRSQMQLNAALREQQALMIRDTYLETARTQFQDTVKNESSDISKNLKDMADNTGVAKEKIGAFVGAATAQLLTLSQTTMSTDDILQKLLQTALKYGATAGDGSWNKSQLEDSINTLKESYKMFTDMTKIANDSFAQSIQEINKVEHDTFLQQTKDLESSMLESYRKWMSETSTAAKNAAMAAYEQAFNRLAAISANAGQTMSSQWGERLDKMKRSTLSSMDAAGNSVKMTAATIRSEMASMDLSVDEAVSQLKRLKEIANLTEDNPQFLKSAREVLGNTTLTAKEASKQLNTLQIELKKYMKEVLHINESGGAVIPTGGGRTNEQKQLKQDIDAWKEYLKAYYEEKQTVEKQAFLDYSNDNHSQDEIDAAYDIMQEKVEALKRQYHEQLSELNRALLGYQNEFGADGLFGTFFSDLIDKGKLKELDTVINEVKQNGRALWDDIYRSMTEEQRKAVDQLIKNYDELYKIITKYDFVQQAEDKFRESLVKQDMYNQQSFAKMQEWALTRKNITIDELKDEFNLQDAQASALLVMLSDYNDSYLDAVKKQNERRVKLIKEGYKEVEDEWQEYIKQYEMWTDDMKRIESYTDSNNSRSLQLELTTLKIKEAAQREYVDMLRLKLQEEWQLRLGFSEEMAQLEAQRQERELQLVNIGMGEFVDDDPELVAIRARIQAMREEIEMRVNMSSQLKDAETAITDIMREQAEKQLEIQQQKNQWVKNYANIVADSVEDVGEALWDEEADWAEVGRNILKSITNQTMEMVKEWGMQIIKKRAMNKAMEAVDSASDKAKIISTQVTARAVNVANASNSLTEMGTKAAQASGDAAAGIASGTSAAMSIGPWGAALVPIVVSVISGALLGAISKIKSAEEEVTEVSGVSSAEASSFVKKKTAAGMLTYASGNYPVLGNDGNVYDATREDRWRTGIYSSPHYGILGEQGPELIVDGQTTNKMLTLRPDLYQDILALRDGIIRSNVRAYASGYYPATATTATVPSVTVPSASPEGTTVPSASPEGLMSVLTQLIATNQELRNTLAGGIVARLVEDFSRDGVINTLEEDRKWMEEHGLLR